MKTVVAHALAENAKLITADEKIRAHCPRAIWPD